MDGTATKLSLLYVTMVVRTIVCLCIMICRGHWSRCLIIGSEVMDRQSKSVHFDGVVLCEIFCSGHILGSSSGGEFGSDSKVFRISLTFGAHDVWQTFQNGQKWIE